MRAKIFLIFALLVAIAYSRSMQDAPIQEICPQVIVYGEDGKVYPTPCEAKKAGVRYSYQPFNKTSDPSVGRVQPWKDIVVENDKVYPTPCDPKRPGVRCSNESSNKTPCASGCRVQPWRDVEPSLDKKLNDLIIVVSLNKGIVDKISLSQSEFKLNSDSELLFIKLNNPLMFVNLSKGCYRYSPDKVTPIECSPETMELMNVGEVVRYLVKKHNEVLGLKVKALVQELKEAYLTIKTKSSPVR